MLKNFRKLSYDWYTMKTIKKSYKIHAPVEAVWRAFVDVKEITEWGGGPVVMYDAVGSKFSLWGGEIHGKNLEVEEHEKLVQEWYGGEWKNPSKVTFLFNPDGEVTQIELTHEKIPNEDADDISEGWDQYYIGAIKEYLES